MSNAALKLTSRAAKPFLKWAGGKRAIVERLHELMPKRFGTYVEPFLGGGALFFEVNPSTAILSDLNSELITTYRVIRDQPEELIEVLKRHRYERAYFYKIRELKPRTLSTLDIAARMIFLNRTGFNGLFRVNKSGVFNVPFGRYKDPVICDRENILACSEALKGSIIENLSFQSFPWDLVRKGDFVYFDPPYVPLSKSSSFTSYVSGGFGKKEQEELAALYRRLDQKGVHLLLSNSATDLIRELYKGFELIEIKVPRAINSKASARGEISELIVRN